MRAELDRVALVITNTNHIFTPHSLWPEQPYSGRQFNILYARLLWVSICADSPPIAPHGSEWSDDYQLRLIRRLCRVGSSLLLYSCLAIVAGEKGFEACCRIPIYAFLRFKFPFAGKFMRNCGIQNCESATRIP